MQRCSDLGLCINQTSLMAPSWWWGCRLSCKQPPLALTPGLSTRCRRPLHLPHSAVVATVAAATVAAVVAAQMLVEVVIMMGRSQPTRQHSYCCCTGSG